MHAQIKILTSSSQDIYLLSPSKYLILGRAHNADIVFEDDESLSRLHCRFYYENQHYWVEDLQSRNHTFVNEALVVDKKQLVSGDIVRIGKNLIQFTLLHNVKDEPRQEDPFILVKRSDKLIGKIAVKLGLLTRDKLRECVQIQLKMAQIGPYFPLIEVMEEEGYLPKEDIEKIKKTKEDIPFKIPNYWLQELIGMGGMGRIYRAISLKTNQRVACKIFCEVPQHLEVALKEQFCKEAAALMQFQHQNIVQGIEFINTKDVLCIIMEFVEGPTLKEYVKEKGERLLSDEAIQIILQVAKALEHAFSKGMIHRDIKPENILITPQGVVKLCDFGLVKSDSVETQEENVFGTVAYMSPEQIIGSKTLDIRSDIYSLGALFYRIFFGHLPFTGDSREVRIKHLQAPLTFPTVPAQLFKNDIIKVIKKMMEKRPEHRYQTPTELIKALESLNVKLQVETKKLLYTEEMLIPRQMRSNANRLQQPIIKKLSAIMNDFWKKLVSLAYE
ncbi:MAG: protein kinase [Planctomycetes bacterium]|mgnify:CR=1 FL=1|jgi:serine/threonine-protein kinase|nr:protein kinase [Planctomycetota bacterium]HPY75573.1 FHA domain-containing serine/threonine-protein kinase [Planctomycetota bacterium]HQB01167.1 FHA domain-containing serine/threonine-protein kinase [Planctomycetota bacterium]